MSHTVFRIVQDLLSRLQESRGPGNGSVDGQVVISYGAAVRGISLICAIAYSAFCFALWKSNELSIGWLSLMVPTVLFTGEVFTKRVLFIGKTISYRTLWRRKFSGTWADISKVDIAEDANDYRLFRNDGKKIVINSIMNGYGRLESLVNHHARAKIVRKRQVVYGGNLKFMPIFLAAIVALATVFAHFDGDTIDSIGEVMGFSFFMFILALMFLEFSTYKISFDEEGVQYSTFFKKSREYKWDELVKVEYKEFQNVLVVTGINGGRIRVAPGGMSGIIHFIEMIKQKLPRKKYIDAEPGFEKAVSGRFQ